jgi:hypothetical protein
LPHRQQASSMRKPTMPWKDHGRLTRHQLLLDSSEAPNHLL